MVARRGVTPVTPATRTKRALAVKPGQANDPPAQAARSTSAAWQTASSIRAIPVRFVIDRASDAYSPNQGARCGAAASTCSQPDTCDASGACAANDLDDGTPCSGGACEAGTCRIQPNPFDCIAPSPPPADFTAPSFSLSGTPPIAKGGPIADGRYAPVRFDLYNSEASGIDIRTFEFKKGYVQAETQYYAIETKASFIPEVRFAGSFAISGSSLTFDLERCDPQYDIDIPSLSYTATSNGLVMIATLSDGGALVTSYLRQ